nr:hypothetical protein GCM10020063_030750 [Dactylosporangium thailandense]
MLKLVERAGERMLARLLPKATATASCPYESWCESCSGNIYKKVWVKPDCTLGTTACNDPWDGC